MSSPYFQDSGFRFTMESQQDPRCCLHIFFQRLRVPVRHGSINKCFASPFPIYLSYLHTSLPTLLRLSFVLTFSKLWYKSWGNIVMLSCSKGVSTSPISHGGGYLSVWSNIYYHFSSWFLYISPFPRCISHCLSAYLSVWSEIYYFSLWYFSSHILTFHIVYCSKMLFSNRLFRMGESDYLYDNLGYRTLSQTKRKILFFFLSICDWFFRLYLWLVCHKRLSSVNHLITMM